MNEIDNGFNLLLFYGLLLQSIKFVKERANHWFNYVTYKKLSLLIILILYS